MSTPKNLMSKSQLLVLSCLASFSAFHVLGRVSLMV